MIKLQVIGNLGNDAVVNNVNGKNVINFSVAHTEKYKDAQGNQQDRTIWVNCAYWTDRLGVQPYLLKGKTVYVEGTPSLEIYTTSDGRQNPKLKLSVREIQLLGGTGTPRPEGGMAQASNMTSQAPSMETNGASSFPVSGGANDAMNEDLPF